ncbi:YebG family protein [Dongshaea marina]|uniref:YebG family protein n=1 Tax=Dongshaea marina TaxID=2047966 RepID=UPI000D3E9C6E|nr:YebG family protein [Dongshaea marina]
MAVETRYVVIRNGEEVLSTTDKKQADEHDRMLDMADELSVLLEGVEVALDDRQREELSIYLAKNREAVLVALGAKKVKAAKSQPKPKADDNSAEQPAVDDKEQAA